MSDLPQRMGPQLELHSVGSGFCTPHKISWRVCFLINAHVLLQVFMTFIKAVPHTPIYPSGFVAWQPYKSKAPPTVYMF